MFFLQVLFLRYQTIFTLFLGWTKWHGFASKPSSTRRAPESTLWRSPTRRPKTPLAMGILQLLVQYFDIFTSTFLRLFLYSKSQVQNPDSPNKTEPLDVEELASSRSGLAPNSESQDRREVHGADVCRESDP